MYAVLKGMQGDHLIGEIDQKVTSLPGLDLQLQYHPLVNSSYFLKAIACDCRALVQVLRWFHRFMDIMTVHGSPKEKGSPE